MLSHKITLVLLFLIISTPVAAAKKRCKPLLEKLQNIQALQRNGYSSKRGQSLRNREDKARDKWWECEKGTSKVKQSSKKKKSNKTARNSVQERRVKNEVISAGVPFKTNNVIFIKSKYQGEKKQAWFEYYQQPDKCSSPKSLSVFAYCSENKQLQQASFEKKYSK
jgi:hypothetical protein